jgi:hypothetical protein
MRKGQLVKVSRKGERFWVIVKKVFKKSFLGKIDNHLLNKNIKFGTTIRFNNKDIR